MSSTDISNILKQLDELSQPRQLPALFKPHNISPVLGSPEKKNPMSGYFVGGEGAEPDAKPVWYAIRHRETGRTLSSHKDEAAARDEMAGLGDQRQEYKLVKTSRRPNQFGLDEEDSGGQQYVVTIDAIDHGVLSPITVTASSPAAAKQKAIASATTSMAKRGYELQVRSVGVKSAQGMEEGMNDWALKDKPKAKSIPQTSGMNSYAMKGDVHNKAYEYPPTHYDKDGKDMYGQKKPELKSQTEGVAESDEPGYVKYEQMKDKISGVLIKLYKQGKDAETIKQMGSRVAKHLGYDPTDSIYQDAWLTSFNDASLDGSLDQDSDDDYTDYSMRQGERGNPGKFREQGVAENVAGDVNSKKRYHFLYPHVPLDMHTDHEYNDLSDRDLQAVKSHQRELAYKLGKPGAKEQSDIASHIQINRARSQYDQEQAHRRKVLDAEKTKRQARDAKRQQGVAEGSSSPDEYERRLASIQSLRYDNPQEYAKQYRALLQAMPEEHAAHANQAQKGSYSPGERGSGTGSTGRVAEEASPMIKPPSDRFDSKQEAFAHAKAHGGKVFKSTYTDPNTGNKHVSFVVKKDQDVEEGWKQKLGAAALAGSMAMGASARVVPGQDEPGVNRLTGKPNVSQVVPDVPEQPILKGFSTSYLQKAADPNRFGRFLISVEDAKAEVDRRAAAYELRSQGDQKTNEQGVAEVAPPGAEAERMVKHIKQGYAKDGKLTGKEKAIAYATTWKAHNQGQVEEASTDLVGFHLDTERAYNAVMERFGDVVEQDQESGMMTVPRRYWLQLEQVAHDADGIGAIEAGGEKIAVDEVEESYWQPQIDEAIAQEDVLDKEKRHLGDYLQSVADAVKHDAALSSKDTPTHSGDTIGSAVKTVTTDDGHDLKIHGNEDDGFRISIKGRPSRVKFKSLDEAGMACEMYRSHRRHKLESADYIEEQ
jgi:hypothetical protein